MTALLIVALCIVGLTFTIDLVVFLLTDNDAELRSVAFNIPGTLLALVTLAIALAKLP